MKKHDLDGDGDLNFCEYVNMLIDYYDLKDKYEKKFVKADEEGNIVHET